MFAIIRTGGKQYKVEEGLTLKVEKLPNDVGESIEFDEVLLVSGGDGVVIPEPGAGKATVKATVTGQVKGPKVIVFKYKPKKGYHRKQGHRQQYTEVRIDGISLGAPSKAKGGKEKKAEAAAE